MNEFILLPADTYIVINKTVLNDQDRKLLISLYQPIIGSLSISLYFSLWSYLDKMELCGIEWTHHHLMGNMGISLNEIYIAREKLEAIGLLKTYVKKSNINHYVYELYSPLSANEFLTNPILATSLYNNIGDSEYHKVVDSFKMPKINIKDYADITKKFTDVYDSMTTNTLIATSSDIRKRTRLKLELTSKIDLDNVFSSIPDDILNYKSITKETRELLYRLGFIYDLDDVMTIELIRSSINDKKVIDKNMLRKNARNCYTFEHDGKLPSIAYKNQPDYLKKPAGDTSPLARMIYQFETTSPYDFLCGKNHGVKPSKSDKLVLEYLLIEIGMMPGVVNVLIDYVLRINNNKLNKNFVEVIANQWLKSNIKTVADAIALAQTEMAAKKTYKNNKVKTSVKKPAWFDENVDSVKASDAEINEMKKLLGQYR